MKHCVKCGGVGKLLGNGMLSRMCTYCDGLGKIDDDESKPSQEKPAIDKRSKAYRDAIKTIVDGAPHLTRQQAEEIFVENYS